MKRWNCFIFLGEPGADCGNETPVFSIIEAPKEHSAGFLWLKLEDKYLTQWEKFCLRRHIGNEGCSLLSSNLWRETIRRTLENAMNNRMKAHIDVNLITDGVNITVTNSGPALTVEIVGFTNEKLCSKIQTHQIFHADFTLGLHCKSWPQKAKGQLTLIFVDKYIGRHAFCGKGSNENSLSLCKYIYLIEKNK